MAQVKEVKGPGPRRMGGPKPKVENPGKLLKRIMDEVFKHYLPHCILVLVCIIVSALANVQASLFLKTLIDDYIVPMTKQATPDFGPLAGALVRIGCIYAIGVLAAWLNARIMVNVTQGTLRNLRVQLFTHMESLPIRYFDSHSHGDIMSVYTNDVDTLRQMISQSIPQLVSSAITIVSVFTSMCLMSWQLTVVTMLMVALMLFCSKKITSMSGKYFVAQQKDLGKVNGYIEEMMEGQKVVKVFTHEQKALDGFRQLNDKLKESAKQANSYANIIMPVTAQLGNISYAVCALAGAAMAVGNVGGMTLGTVMAFLSLNKSFNMPISQVSMQANSVIMALAGAERIFKMMDETSEADEYNGVVIRGECYDRQFMFGKGAGSLPTASSILSDIMARLNNYRYEYKKMNYIEKPDYTTDITLKIYARYKETDVQGILNFSKIHEQFISEESNYVIGEIPLRELLEKRSQLSGRDVFLANIPIFFLNRD